MTENKNGLYKKMLAFQSKVGVIIKDATNPYYKSKYADINAILDVVKPVLSDCGLVVYQPLVSEAGRLYIKTIIVDAETGESVEGMCILPENPDVQKLGAIICYFRRYSLQSALLLRMEDNDANETVIKPKVEPKQYAKVNKFEPPF